MGRDGSIQTRIVEFSVTRVIVEASIYRTADDIRPCVDSSYLNIPGSTPYTKGSELENASTSAVGRALAYMGYEVKKSIASQEEVSMKQDAPKKRGRPAKKTDVLVEAAIAAGAIPKCKKCDVELIQSSTGTWGHLLADGTGCTIGADIGVEIQGAN